MKTLMTTIFDAFQRAMKNLSSAGSGGRGGEISGALLIQALKRCENQEAHR